MTVRGLEKSSGFLRDVLKFFAATGAVLLLCLAAVSESSAQRRRTPATANSSQTHDGLNAQSRLSVENAVSAFERDDLETAETEARNAVRLSPRSPVAQNLLGAILDKRGVADGAFRAYQKAITLSPKFVSAKNNLGNWYAQRGKFAEAITLFQQVLRLDPNHLQARYNLGAIYAESGEIVKAAENFLVLRKVNPQDPQIALAFLNVGYRAKMEPEANEAADLVETAVGNDPKGMFTLALALAQNSQFERALPLFQKVNELQPKTFEVLYNLGLVYDNLKREDEAVQILAEAADLNSDPPETHLRLGLIASERNDHVNAAEEFRHAISRQPKNDYVHFLLAREFFRAGYWEGAINEYSEAIKLNPKESAYLAGRASANYRKGEWVAAANDYDAVANIAPDFKDIDYLRGYTYRAAGNFDKAREILEKFLLKNPNHADALASLGYVALEQGRLEDAKAPLEKALSLDKNDAAVLFDYARVAVKEKDYGEAVKRLEAVAALNRFNPQVQYQLFLVYSRLKQIEKANVALSEFKRLDALEKQAREERILDEKLRTQKMLGNNP